MSEEKEQSHGKRPLLIVRFLPLIIGGIVVYELAMIITLLSLLLIEEQNRTEQPVLIIHETPKEQDEETSD